MRDYDEPKLQRKKKGGNWQVSIRFPEQIRRYPDHRKRVSTNTPDLRLAEKLAHKIKEEIYAEFDRLLGVDPLIELLKLHWPKDKHQSVEDYINDAPKARNGDYIYDESFWVRPPLPNYLIETGETPVDMKRIYACREVCYTSDGNPMSPMEFNHPLANKIYDHLTKSEAKEWYRMWTSMQAPLGKDPRPLNLREPKEPDGDEQKTVLQKLKDGEYLNKTGAPKLSDCVQAYSNSEKWNGIRNKTKNDTLSLIPNCINIIGDLPVDQVYRSHATMIARTLHEDGYSNSRIKTWLGSIRGLLEYVVDNELNHVVNPPKPWITTNSFYGFSTKAYGAKKRSWQPLTEEQLFALFALDMPQQDRLLLNILITTGMRLDEAALLEWEQYKEDRNGLRYFDLSLGSIVKNDRFSARTVAIPDVLQLPNVATGRLFHFKTDSDGKSSKDASRYLNESYVHKVRLDENDDRKVVHSLRHNLTGFMLNLKPTPSSEVMDWITGHGMEGNKTQSERQRTYGQDPDVSVKYEIVNQIKHPWLSANK